MTKLTNQPCQARARFEANEREFVADNRPNPSSETSRV